MIQTINFNGKDYPKLQSEGFAAQWVFTFAQKLCTGVGFDVGCNRMEWCLPGAAPVDPLFTIGVDAMNLPQRRIKDGIHYDLTSVDYIFSSHCLEHLRDWVAALDYWYTKLKQGGVCFLYLPDMSVQGYWQPWHNRKHLHYLEPKILQWYFDCRKEMWKNVFVTGFDLNYSFTVIAEKI